jgi:hypothetical protein
MIFASPVVVSEGSTLLTRRANKLGSTSFNVTYIPDTLGTLSKASTFLMNASKSLKYPLLVRYLEALSMILNSIT